MNLLNTNFDCSKYAKAKLGENYVKYFIGFDVRSVHILRFQENINEEYEEDNGCILLEHEMIDYFPDIESYFEEEKNVPEYNGDDRVYIDWLLKQMNMTDILKTIIDLDEYNGLENWDCTSDYCSLDEMIDRYINSNGNISNITI